MDIPATNITVTTVMRRETLFFTGGLAVQWLVDGNHALFPAGFSDGEITALQSSPLGIQKLLHLVHVAPVGVNQTQDNETGAPSDIWQPMVAVTAPGLHSADSWGAIAYQADVHQDPDYANTARYLSASIHAASIRLRDVARGHHRQLGWALMEGRSPNRSFSNLALTDLYLAFHSLATELCAARDYLAQIAGLHCGAKRSLDSMAWFYEWLIRPANAGKGADPLTVLLTDAWGPKDVPGWLRELGEVRNQLVHRQPMSANPDTAALALIQHATPSGALFTIRLAPKICKGVDLQALMDPFRKLLDLYNAFEQLAVKASAVARYKAVLPNVVGV